MLHHHRHLNYFPLAIMTFLAALTFWLAQTSRVETVQLLNRQRHIPDFVVEKFSMQRFDQQGRLDYQLGAVRMTHYLDDNLSELKQPTLDYFSTPQATHLRAERAWITGRAERVRLEEQVRVWREPLAQSQLLGMQFSTTQLDIWPDEQRLDTTQPVSLVQGHSIIQAHRLHADNLSGVLELGGGVSATVVSRH